MSTITISGLEYAIPPSGGDFIPLGQPDAVNPVTLAKGDTRKIRVKTLAEYMTMPLLADQMEAYGRDLFDVFGIKTGTTAQKIAVAMAEIRRRCNNNGEVDTSGIPDFTGLMIGDYLDGIDLSGIAAAPGGTAPGAWNNTYKNNRIVLSGLNTFKSTGDTENAKNHLLFTFRNAICTGRMNPTNTNTGGYPATELRAWLEGANGDGTGAYSGVTTAAFLNGLKAALGGHIYTHRALLSTKGDWEPVWRTVFLPTTHEMWGAPGWAETNYDGGFQVQFPIYQKSVEYKIKRYNGLRVQCWNASPSDLSAANFCVSHGSGSSGDRPASAVASIAPAFCVV
jgi:hypothetical protein